ncbi:MAG: DUF655 domain-containing protein [Candidatus Aenigmarchaeota archaeon]|nr:DUF655 domain-containing protein [Candidatus Aenigmarchaeota archaeon]
MYFVMFMKDEWVIILDFLPNGHPGRGKPEPIAQAVGEKYFSLLEIVPKDGVTLSLGDRVYIGDGVRDKVKYIKRSISLNELTTVSRSELEEVVKDIVREDEGRFIKFFNESGPISTRMHSLELLPGIGKKHMWEIIKLRKEEPFKSYEDLKKRVPSIPDPQKMIARRIMMELKGEDPRHRLFVLHRKREFD